MPQIKTHSSIVLLLFLCIPIMLMGQQFDAERIFLATEKSHYNPGDLITVHGLLSAACQSDRQPYSRYIYIECISPQDSVVLQKKIACDNNGYFNTNIATHSLWPASVYYLRAYTQLMQNYEPESLTMLPVLIGTVHPTKPKEVREVYARMFPESGRLLTNFRQNIVFDLSDNQGFPILPDQVQLVTDDRDTVIRQIKVSNQGLGQFSFQPTPDKQYQLQVEYNSRIFHFPVETSDLGTALQATINRNRLTVHLFGLQQTTVYHLFIYHAAIGLKEIPLHPEQQAMMIDLSAYPKGIYTLFLTDATCHPLNERSLWFPSSEATHVNCQLTSTSYGGGTKLNYQLTAPDSSIVLTRIVPNYDLFTQQAYPNVQFGNELISPKRFPFIESEDWITHKEEIDQWLQTAHFALFDIEKLFNEENTHSYVAEDVMLLKGVARDKEHKPLKGNHIINVENRKDQLYYSGVTDEKGHFAIPVDNFSEGTHFLLSAQNRKGNNIACTFALDTNRSPQIVIPHLHFSATLSPSNTQMNNQSLPYSMDENQEKVYHIDNVTVEARKRINIHEAKRTPLNFIGEQELQERGGLSLRSILSRFPSITVRETTEGGGIGELGALQQIERFSRMTDRTGDLSTTSNGELGIYWKSSIGQKDPIKLTLVIDGEISFGSINTLLDQPAGAIESIEIVRPSDSRCVPYNAKGGLVLIKTRFGLITETTEQTKVKVKPLGLSASSSSKPKPEPEAPHQPGNYLLLIDVISPERQVYSFCQPFTVRP